MRGFLPQDDGSETTDYDAEDGLDSLTMDEDE